MQIVVARDARIDGSSGPMREVAELSSMKMRSALRRYSSWRPRSNTSTQPSGSRKRYLAGSGSVLMMRVSIPRDLR